MNLMCCCTAGILLLISPSGSSTTTRLSAPLTRFSPFSVRFGEVKLSPLEPISLSGREMGPTLPEGLLPLLSPMIQHF